MQPETNYAWAAGLIDGEGCIRILKVKPRAWAQRASYSVDIRVAMASLAACARLRDIFGVGTLDPKKKPTASHLDLWCWRVPAREVPGVLAKIRPYLTVKAEQADIVLEFVAGRRLFRGDQSAFSIDEKNRQSVASESYFQRCRLLNSRKGKAGKAA